MHGVVVGAAVAPVPMKVMVSTSMRNVSTILSLSNALDMPVRKPVNPVNLLTKGSGFLAFLKRFESGI